MFSRIFVSSVGLSLTIASLSIAEDLSKRIPGPGADYAQNQLFLTLHQLNQLSEEMASPALAHVTVGGEGWIPFTVAHKKQDELVESYLLRAFDFRDLSSAQQLRAVLSNVAEYAFIPKGGSGYGKATFFFHPGISDNLNYLINGQSDAVVSMLERCKTEHSEKLSDSGKATLGRLVDTATRLHSMVDDSNTKVINGRKHIFLKVKGLYAPYLQNELTRVRSQFHQKGCQYSPTNLSNPAAVMQKVEAASKVEIQNAEDLLEQTGVQSSRFRAGLTGLHADFSQLVKEEKMEALEFPSAIPLFAQDNAINLAQMIKTLEKTATMQSIIFIEDRRILKNLSNQLEAGVLCDI